MPLEGMAGKTGSPIKNLAPRTAAAIPSPGKIKLFSAHENKEQLFKR
jgi:hypothetical protein